MTVLRCFTAFVGLLICGGFSIAASGAEFGLLVCSLDRERGLIVTISDFVDADRIAGSRGSVFADDPFGIPCAKAIHAARQAGFDLASRGSLSLCETGICPNPPPPPRPSDPDDDLWDLLGSGIQGSPSTAIVACRLVTDARQPRVAFVQTAGEGAMIDALADAEGRACSAVISEVLKAGGEIDGRSFLPLSGLLRESRGPRSKPSTKLRPRSRGGRSDSIVYELIRR